MLLLNEINVKGEITLNKKVKIIFTILLIIAVLIVLVTINRNKPKEQSSNLKIVSSFYPIHIIAMNLTENTNGVEEVCLTQNNVRLLT